VNDYEYDPEYQEAYKHTLEYQQRRLGYALGDMGNEVVKALWPTLLSSSSMLRGIWSEIHADQFVKWSWPRRWWHIVTGHRK